jgi:hypothetical protein
MDQMINRFSEKFENLFKRPEIVGQMGTISFVRGQEVLFGSNPAEADYVIASTKARRVRLDPALIGRGRVIAENELSRAAIRIGMDHDGGWIFENFSEANMITVWYQDRNKRFQWTRDDFKTPMKAGSKRMSEWGDHIIVDITTLNGTVIRLDDAASTSDLHGVQSRAFTVKINPDMTWPPMAKPPTTTSL